MKAKPTLKFTYFDDRHLPRIDFEFSDKDREMFTVQVVGKNAKVGVQSVLENQSRVYSGQKNAVRPTKDLMQSDRIDIIYRITVLKQSMFSIA